MLLFLAHLRWTLHINLLIEPHTSACMQECMMIIWQWRVGILIHAHDLNVHSIFSLFVSYYCRWRALYFDLCSALVAIEQWGFFRVPLLLWHGALFYNGHIQGPVTLTPVAERLASELSLPVYDLGLSRLGFEHPIATFRMPGKRSNRLRQRRAFVFSRIPGTTWPARALTYMRLQ